MTGPIQLSPQAASDLIAYQAHQIMHLQVTLAAKDGECRQLAQQLAEATKRLQDNQPGAAA